MQCHRDAMFSGLCAGHTFAQSIVRLLDPLLSVDRKKVECNYRSKDGLKAKEIGKPVNEGL